MSRTAFMVRAELTRTTQAQTCHLKQSRSWRALELRRKALALELALISPHTAHACALFHVGAL